ncbi:MAG: rhodanese-related sulfurtransferase [Alphaproteobacteria bacterium]|nr:rhodanese-related sulfurtransferase [Alphaproteobacteria bacterium]
MSKYLDKIALVSFYCFTDIKEPGVLLSKITAICIRKYLKGTVLIAEEGLNGSLSGPEDKIQEIIAYLTNICTTDELIYKINYSASHPFNKLKVKLKKEIVTMAAGPLDVNRLKGEYIEPKAWDEFLQRDDVVVIDTRNDYEFSIGTFKNAINPKTENFREFPEWFEAHKEEFANKKIVMFCTGGIRCEKSTTYAKSRGFNEVFHLKGGILQYLEETGNKNNMWDGDCFVFDERIAVDSNLAPAHQQLHESSHQKFE